MEGCANKCVKWLLFFFNLLFFLGGGLLLGLGIWASINTGSFSQVITSNTSIINTSYIMIAVGGTLMVISFLGCCGAAKESKCMLGLFFFVILVIFVVEFIGGILVFALYPQTERAVLDSMKDYQLNATTLNPQTIGWNFMQTEFPCCGFNSYNDWAENSGGIFPTSNGEKVPDSCCSRESNDVTASFDNRQQCVGLQISAVKQPLYVNLIPCSQRIKEYLWIAGGICLGILLIELLAMVLTCKLYRAISRGKSNI